MITVYSKPNCTFCVRTKNWLTNHNFQFHMVDITADAVAYDFVKNQKGHTSVPQIYYNGQLLVAGGFEGLSKMTAQEVQARMHQFNAVR